MFLALLPVTAIPVHAAGSIAYVTINSDGTCSGGTAGYSACEVKTGARYNYTDITVNQGFTLVISNPSRRYVSSSEVNNVSVAPLVYLVKGDYAGGDTDSNSATRVLSDGSITGGTFSGEVINFNGTIFYGTFSGDVDNYKVISGGTFSGTVDNELLATISGGTFKGYVVNEIKGIISGSPRFINGITGVTGMTLPVGYSAASTQEYMIEGGRVSKESGNDKITWDDVNKKLDIAAGLDVGSYPVVLRTSNGDGIGKDNTFTFTFVVNPINEDHPFKYDDFNDIIKQYGDADFAQPVTDAMAGRAVTYSSSNTEVATVDRSTGKVTIISVGTATIKASVEQTVM